MLGLIERSVGALEPELRVGLAGMGSETQAERVRNDLAFEFGRRRLEGFTQVIGDAFSAFAINTLKDQDELLPPKRPTISVWRELARKILAKLRSTASPAAWP